MERNDPTCDSTLGGGRMNHDADDTTTHNRASDSIKQQQIDKDCQKCIKYLKSALDKVGSRPHSLLHALGVISHTDINNNESKVYEPTRDGVLISLENSSKEKLATNSPNVLVNVSSGKKHDVSNINNVSKQHIETAASSNQERKEVTLARRMTKVAEYMLNNDGAHIPVLTTSPTVKNAQQSDIETTEIENPTKKITTIAIECMKCGSDTRAESGARAYVRGPEPLSIVLCSNRLGSQREVDEVLVHELVHIYDVHSRQMDLRDCKSLAYSEVRAAREAECSNSLTSFTGNICAKDKATVATRNMFPEEGRKCVCSVFDRAIKDYAPFGDDTKGGGQENATSLSQHLKAHQTEDYTRHHVPLSTPRESDR